MSCERGGITTSATPERRFINASSGWSSSYCSISVRAWPLKSGAIERGVRWGSNRSPNSTTTAVTATVCGMVNMLHNMAGRTSWTLANSLVALAVMVVVDLLLLPRLGILGAGIGWAAAIVTNNAVPLTQLWRSMGLHPFGRATLRAAAL